MIIGTHHAAVKLRMVTKPGLHKSPEGGLRAEFRVRQSLSRFRRRAEGLAGLFFCDQARGRRDAILEDVVNGTEFGDHEQFLALLG